MQQATGNGSGAPRAGDAQVAGALSSSSSSAAAAAPAVAASTPDERARSVPRTPQMEMLSALVSASTVALGKEEASGSVAASSPEAPSLYRLACAFINPELHLQRTNEYFYSSYTSRRRLLGGSQPFFPPADPVQPNTEPRPPAEAGRGDMEAFERVLRGLSAKEAPRLSPSELLEETRTRARRWRAWSVERSRRRAQRHDQRWLALRRLIRLHFKGPGSLSEVPGWH